MMQIDPIKIADYIKTDDTQGRMTSSVDTADEAKTETLRNISIDSPVYSKNELKEQTVADSLENHLNSGDDGKDRMDEIAVCAGTMSEQDVAKMQEDGYSLMDTDVDTIVTVTDRIKLALAKGGADISSMGGLDADTIAAIEGDSPRVALLEKKIAELDVPADEVDITAAETAFDQAAELPKQLSEDAVKYMLKENFTPTIDHLYEATFGGGSALYTSDAEPFASDVAEISDVIAEISGVIEGAGYEATDAMVSDAGWMIRQDLPLTEETFSYFEDLKTKELSTDVEDVAQALADAAFEGKEPGEAILLSDYNPVQTARDVYANQMEELDQLSSDITRQEARMMLSVEANYTLIKQGIAIDTISIQETIDALKDLQQNQLASLVGAPTDSDEQMTEKGSLYEEVSEQITFLKQAPAAFLAEVSDISEQTLPELSSSVAAYTAKFTSATESYETLWTSPRADLGDSIQKAFTNVDAILEDLELDTTAENERAVRILSYNEKEITKETIAEVKSADTQVQKLFAALKPATVLAMIREGENPLDKNIADLTRDANSFANDDENQEENFAKFLWKTEHTDGVTEEERQSYIGLYRLIHQVEATDGAVVGALLEQHTEVTLRNLMTAVRSRNHTDRSYTIDDDFGGVDAIRDSLSITDQIEMAYQTNCLSQAGEVMTPVLMKEFPDESSYMELTPDGFRDALYESLSDDAVSLADQQIEEEYSRVRREEVANALRSESQVYEILERADLPQTPAFLSGIQQMLSDRNQVYRKLLQYTAADGEESSDISDLMEQLIEDFGEAVKTPEEMAEAERRLEDTAENVMRNMLVSEDVREIDVRDMKLVVTQLHALGQMGQQSEVYHLPIMVADQAGNLTLKIVRGEEQKGLVDVALSTESTGAIYGSFHYEAGEIDADITFERRDMQQAFSESLPQIAESMGEETGLPISFSTPRDKDLDINQIYEEATTDFVQTRERDEISTRVLYGIAHSFIENLEEIISGGPNFF